jgi:hypothetical protein
LSVQLADPSLLRGLSGGGVNPGTRVKPVVGVAGMVVAVALGKMTIGVSVAVASACVAVITSGSAVFRGSSVRIGGNSPEGRPLVGEGISVRILATRVAISESETAGGVVVRGNEQAVKTPSSMIVIIKGNNLFERIFFSSNLI